MKRCDGFIEYGTHIQFKCYCKSLEQTADAAVDSPAEIEHYPLSILSASLYFPRLFRGSSGFSAEAL